MFTDRFDAGRKLAERLEQYKGDARVIVLAIPRGGVVVGRVIADALNVPLDVIVTRKLGMPGQVELAIGAVDRDGKVVLRDPSAVDGEKLEDLIAKERDEIHRRELLFRGERKYPDLLGKMVILVDDGVATGMTMQAAIQWIRRQRPQKIILAIPVAPPDSLSKLKEDVDECIVLETPEMFFAVGQFYRDFREVQDTEVAHLLKEPTPSF